jgi:hypothetical protein
MFLFSVSFRFFLSSEPLGNNITAESQLYRAARVRWPRRRRQWTHSRTYLTVPCSAARFRMFRRAAVRNVQPWGQRTSPGRAAKTDGRLRDFFLMTNVSWPCQSRLFSNPHPLPSINYGQTPVPFCVARTSQIKYAGLLLPGFDYSDTFATHRTSALIDRTCWLDQIRLIIHAARWCWRWGVAPCLLTLPR